MRRKVNYNISSFSVNVLLKKRSWNRFVKLVDKTMGKINKKPIFNNPAGNVLFTGFDGELYDKKYWVGKAKFSIKHNLDYNDELGDTWLKMQRKDGSWDYIIQTEDEEGNKIKPKKLYDYADLSKLESYFVS